MPEQDLSTAQAGMVLERDVCLNGRILLPAGAALTARHLDLLRGHGIECVSVRDQAGEPTAPALSPAAAAAELERRFLHLDPSDPLVAVLQRLSRERLGLEQSDEETDP